MNISWAQPGQIPEIQQFLHTNMGKVSFEAWRNILDCRWIPENDRFGAVVMDGGRVRGFLGIVFADRMLGGTNQRTGNITSWFLEPGMRRAGLGQEMLDLVTFARHVTYTATSPNFRSGALLEKIGWQVLEDKKFSWNFTGKAPDAGFSMATGPDLPFERLDSASQAILRDHQGLNMTPHMVQPPGEAHFFLVTYLKYKGDDIATHEILHVSDRESFSRHARQVANCLLDNDKSVLSADSRFSASGVSCDRQNTIEIKRYFKSPCLTRFDIDFLYSEIVLLDLKIY